MAATACPPDPSWTGGIHRGPVCRNAPWGAEQPLPGEGDLLALTADDGVYSSWTEHVDLLRPLVDDGQIQLANHTWSHPNLTKLPLSAVAEELRHNHDFLWRTYGVDVRPYFRPPYARTTNTSTRSRATLAIPSTRCGRDRWRTTP